MKASPPIHFGPSERGNALRKQIAGLEKEANAVASYADYLEGQLADQRSTVARLDDEVAALVEQADALDAATDSDSEREDELWAIRRDTRQMTMTLEPAA